MKHILLLLALIGLSFGEPLYVNNYYQIETVEDLNWFRDKVNSYNSSNVNLNAKLMADIDYGNQLWIPIAAGTGTPKFAGIFDGNGHTISNYYMDSDTLKKLNDHYPQNLGFIGTMSGTVKNLNLSNITVTSYSVGGKTPGATDNSADGKEKKAICIGTIVGWMDATGLVDSSSATGVLNGFGDGQNVGGIAGNTWGTIKNSSSAVTINVKNLSFVGGIVGMTKKNITIDSVLWEGNINVVADGTTYIGGIIGDVYEGTAHVSNATFISDNVTNSVGKVHSENAVVADKLDYGVYSILFKDNKKILVLDGNYTKTMSETVFDKEFTVDSLIFNRKFNAGKYNTFELPITIAKTEVNTAFYELNDIYKNPTWEVHLKAVTGDSLYAGVPYIIIPQTDTVKITARTFNVKPVEPQKVYNSTNQWSLNSYHRFMYGSDFGDDLNKVYGFAGIAADNAKAGDFVKCGQYVKFKPFRVYLHRETSNALLKARRYDYGELDTINYDIPIYIDSTVKDTIVEIAPVIDIEEQPTIILQKNKVKVYKPNKRKYYNLLGRRINK